MKRFSQSSLRDLWRSRHIPALKRRAIFKMSLWDRAPAVIQKLRCARNVFEFKNLLDRNLSAKYSQDMEKDRLHKAAFIFRVGIVRVYDREIHLWDALEA